MTRTANPILQIRQFHPHMEVWAATAGVAPPVALSGVATALEYRPDISSRLGRDIFLKREDTADALGCGHKLRKLCFLMPEVLKADKTVLVTTGSLPSNQCKAVARAARLCGLRAHVVFLGDHQEKPFSAHGNYLLTSLLDPQITWYARTPWASADVVVESIVAEEAARGERPFVITSGISEGAGLLASIEMGYEISEQIGAVDHDRVAIVAVAGSGGTCLGVKLAAESLGLKWRVFGCSIGESEATVRNRIRLYREQFHNQFSWGAEDDGRLIVTEEVIGLGYDRPQPHEMETALRVAREYGLIFDLNYMVKAYLGLEKLIASPAFDDVELAVLVHSGGHIGMFDGNPGFAAWHGQRFPEWVC